MQGFLREEENGCGSLRRQPALQNRLRGSDPVLGGFDSHVAPPVHFAGLLCLAVRQMPLIPAGVGPGVCARLVPIVSADLLLGLVLDALEHGFKIGHGLLLDAR